MELIPQIRRSTEEWLGVLDRVPEEYATLKPAPEKWNVLELVEHMVSVERGIPKLLSFPSFKRTENGSIEHLGKERLFTFTTNRDNKITAPSFVTPQGRYKSIAEAKTYFSGVRQNLVELLENDKIPFDDFLRPHPAFGPMTNLDWMHFIIAHADRHKQQLMEIVSFNSTKY